MRLLICLSFAVVSLTTLAQRHEFGFTGGVMYYLGDLNPIIPFKKPYPAGGILYRYNIDPHFTIKTNALYGKIGADDAQSSNAYQKTRNLRFESEVIELSSMLEFNFFAYEPGNHKQFNFTPYLFIGLGAMYFNPKSNYEGQMLALKDLNTEAQRIVSGTKSYSLFQPVMPFGIGFKANPFKGFTMSIEWGMRLTMTDYLDDVGGRYADPLLLAMASGKPAVVLADPSINVTVDNYNRQRGFKNSKDWYSYAGFYLCYRIKEKRICWRPGDKYRFPRIAKKKAFSF